MLGKLSDRLMNAVRFARRASLLLVGLLGTGETAESPLLAPRPSQLIGPAAFEGDPFSMLASPGVREELELEEVQSNELAKIRREMERELDALRRNLAAKYQTKIAGVLEPQQNERMWQIALQMRGVAGLFDADMAKKLGLSDGNGLLFSYAGRSSRCHDSLHPPRRWPSFASRCTLDRQLPRTTPSGADFHATWII